MRIGCRLRAAVANSVYVGLYHSATAQFASAPTAISKLLAEIVKIEALRLAVLIMRNYKIRNRLSLSGDGLGVARLLALRLTRGFFSPFLLACPLLLSFGESGTRASCHRFRLPLILILFSPQRVQYSKVADGAQPETLIARATACADECRWRSAH
jgi:hypothetical protein